MRRMCWVGFVLAAVALSACGDDGGAVRAGPKRDASTSGSAGRSSIHKDAGMRDAGDEPGDGAVPVKPSDSGVDPAAPIIEFLTPKALKDPNSGDVLTTPMVTARCKVTMSSAAGARDVNQSTVKITLVNMSDPTKPLLAGVVVNAGNDEFTADFDLSEQPNGPLQFACTAADVSKPALTGLATLDTFLDLGPTIELMEPADGSAHQLTKAVHVAFRVTDWPVSLDDMQATTTGIHLVVSGQDFDMEIMADPTEAGLYTADIDFQDPAHFPMAPETAEIIVTASSSRTPIAAERRAVAEIAIDAEPPEIAIVTPKALALVRGDVTIQITVTDPSGVDNSTVIATVLVAGEPHVISGSDWLINKTTYTSHFDTGGFDAKATQITINVSATDKVGNETVSPASVVVRLDNVPPIISLDPPLIREYKDSNGTAVCSLAFDPVGDNATNDLDTVVTESLYRAMTWDKTNHAQGEEISYVAGIDNSKVKLYAQPDTTIPLLIDKDLDDAHICDEINYEDLAIADLPAVVNLAPITRKGSAAYSTVADFDNPLHMPAPGFCTAGPTAIDKTPLCPNTEMFRAIPQLIDVANPPGAIFAMSPTNSGIGVCNGNSWAVPFGGHEGWVCIAARVEDTIGNVGVSRPLRVCYDDPSTAFMPDCSPQAGEAVTCTQDCSPPADFPKNQVYLQK